MIRGQRLRKGGDFALMLAACAVVSSAQVELESSAGTITVPKEKFHLCIVLGHSNALGAGPFSPCPTTWKPDTTPHPRCWNYHLGTTNMPSRMGGYRPAFGKWIPARCPLHYEEGEGYWWSNPGLRMLEELVNHFPDDHYFGIITVPETVCWISRQQKDYDDPDRIARYDHAPKNVYHEWMDVAKPLVGKVTLGALYMDAISDDRMPVSDMVRFIDSVRADLNDPSFHVIWSQVPYNGTGSWSYSYQVMKDNEKRIDSLEILRNNVTTLPVYQDIPVAAKQHFCPNGNDSIGVRLARIIAASSASTRNGRPIAPLVRGGSRPALPPSAMRVYDMRGRVATANGGLRFSGVRVGFPRETGHGGARKLIGNGSAVH